MRHICDVCNVHCSSAVLLEEHYTGKRHANAVSEAQRLSDIAERSIFLSNFHSPVDVGDVRLALQEFGEMDRVLIDKNNFSHAIVEFRNCENAQKLLSSVKKIKIGESLVNVHKRKVDFDKKLSEDQLNAKNVIECLQNIKENEQVDTLILRFGLSDEQRKQRFEFVKRLEQFLQKFFVSSIEVRIFGSTTTGLAFLASDIDLNLLFKDENNRIVDIVEFPASPSCSTNSECETIDSEERFDYAKILKNPLSKIAFMEFSKSERIRLLSRLINEFRKETGTLSKIIPALDAKCPVVRFILKLSSGLPKRKRIFYLSFELSVSNLLGEKKANFVKDVIEMDSSGNLRKFFFLIKLWAHCNELFQPAQQAQSKTCWNSYTISLLVISFLYSKGILKPISMGKNSTTIIQGWQTEYSMQKVDLTGISLKNYIKELFIFLYNFVGSYVHCIQEGIICKKEEFEQKYLINSTSTAMQNFKLSLVNVQDPLELSHNVAQNVSSKSLTRLRAALMFSIYLLKRQKNENICEIFLKDELEAKFVADTNANSARNSEQKAEKNLITLFRDNSQLPEAIIFDSFASLLNDVLLLNEIEEPMSKLSRGEPLLSKNKTAEFSAHDYHFNFAVSSATWLGRRALRKTLGKISKDLSPLLLEKEISKELRNKTESKDLILNFAVRLFLDPISSNGATLERELYGRFWTLPHPDIDPSNSTQADSFRELLHFLATFVPKNLPLLLSKQAIPKRNEELSLQKNLPQTISGLSQMDEDEMNCEAEINDVEEMEFN